MNPARMADWAQIVRGPDTTTDKDWLRARAWTVFGLAAVADWTGPRPAGRTMAGTFRVQSATALRTQKP